MILWSGPLVTTLEQLRFQFLTDGKEEFWDHHTDAEAHDHVRSDPDCYSFVASDPIDSLRQLTIPSLWLYGERDVSVPVGMSIERLEPLTASGKPFKYLVYPGSGHELPFREALSASVGWLNKSVVPSRR
jgi:pimeloyl-ACP methyl ester carboxylesterase